MRSQLLSMKPSHWSKLRFCKGCPLAQLSLSELRHHSFSLYGWPLQENDRLHWCCLFSPTLLLTLELMEFQKSERKNKIFLLVFKHPKNIFIQTIPKCDLPCEMEPQVIKFGQFWTKIILKIGNVRAWKPFSSISIHPNFNFFDFPTPFAVD